MVDIFKYFDTTIIADINLRSFNYVHQYPSIIVKTILFGMLYSTKTPDYFEDISPLSTGCYLSMFIAA